MIFYAPLSHFYDTFAGFVQRSQFESRIERKWLALFPNIDSYLNKTVEVRGWLNRQQKHFSVLIRHPSAIIELQQ